MTDRTHPAGAPIRPGSPPGQPLRRARGIVLLAVVLAAGAWAHGAGRTQEAVRVSLGGQEMVLPALVEGAAEFVSLKAAAAAVGARFERPADGRWLVRGDGGTADFSSGRPSLVLIGSRSLSLGADAIERDGDLFVPGAALATLLAEIGERAAEAPGPTPAGPAWALTGAGDGRLLLDLPLDDAPKSVRTRRHADGRYLVRARLHAPFTPPWTTKRFDISLIESLDVRAESGTLELAIVPGPRLADVRATLRDEPPGLEVLLIAAADPAARDAGPAPVAAAPRPVRRVVLDPGHGGAEEGATGPNGLTEKELVLDVASRLATLLRFEGFEVILTRDGDVDLPLDERAAVANEYRADLFVSLHANASRYSGAFGAETFFLAAEATDDEARTLAALENDAARLDDDARAAGSEELPLILWNMAQVAYLQESARLAETIQRRLNRLLDIRDRGVRQAPFRVLVGATCPAVLVELGFVTNRSEAARLASGEHRQQLAEALRDAISTFRGSRLAPTAGRGVSAP